VVATDGGIVRGGGRLMAGDGPRRSRAMSTFVVSEHGAVTIIWVQVVAAGTPSEERTSHRALRQPWVDWRVVMPRFVDARARLRCLWPPVAIQTTLCSWPYAAIVPSGGVIDTGNRQVQRR
jgi:hypothetical protein